MKKQFFMRAILMGSSLRHKKSMRAVNEKSVTIRVRGSIIVAMNRQPFEYTEKRLGETLLVRFSGSIDEAARLPDLSVKSELYLNLGGVTALNSFGTRHWCIWLQRFKAPIKV